MQTFRGYRNARGSIRPSRTVGQRTIRRTLAPATPDDGQRRADRTVVYGTRFGGIRRGNGSGISGAISVHAWNPCQHVSRSIYGRCGNSPDFGSAEQTNQRFKYLLEKGQSGLSTAFDLPTLMGLDSDDPRSRGEVGRLGVATDTIDDMRNLFDGIDLEKVSVSMTINAPAIVTMAFYLAMAQERGLSWKKLAGTIQNDALKEFHAQNEIVFPAEPSVKLVVDLIEFCTEHVPRWNTVSISGYHIREAGSTAAQELAFTLADGMHYVEQCLERGMDVDTFAPRLSFFFNAHNDLFEEIAKYRAARIIWADAHAESIRRP